MKSQTETRVYEALVGWWRENPDRPCTSHEVAELVGMSASGTRSMLANLVREGRVVRCGSDKRPIYLPVEIMRGK